jgi:NTP pyrophosphatase (non-canonical NTP hydrolase)
MQQKVKIFNENIKKTNDMPVYARLLDIQSEMGELAKEYLKGSNYGEDAFEMSEDFELELGDVLYSIFSLANELSIDSNIALDRVLEKYKKRFDERNNLGSGR